MYMSCTNINTCDNEIFSIENTPDICVYKACCASMAIPLLFKPINMGENYYYDGALTNNFPIKIFINVPRENIIGMILYNEKKIVEPVKKINLIYIIRQLMTILNTLRVKQVLLKELQDNKFTDYYNPNNLILHSSMNITLNRKGMRLHITKTEMDDMIYVGFETMTKYIEDRQKKYIDDNDARTKDIL